MKVWYDVAIFQRAAYHEVKDFGLMKPCCKGIEVNFQHLCDMRTLITKKYGPLLTVRYLKDEEDEPTYMAINHCPSCGALIEYIKRDTYFEVLKLKPTSFWVKEELRGKPNGMD